MIVDLFAGPGGWDEGLRLIDAPDVVGYETDETACLTRTFAGHRTVREDVSEVDPWQLRYEVEGLIASAPCPAFSSAGKQEGIKDIPRLMRLIHEAMHGLGPSVPRAGWEHPESRLVLEPFRWAAALLPRWIACEQVKEVLPFWRAAAETLRSWGYRTWAGILNSADYGVPQTRRRAILLASLDCQPHAPIPTHHDPRKAMPMFGLPWVSMAEALGWGLLSEPAGTVVAGASRTGGASPLDGGTGARRRYTDAQDRGDWLLHTNRDQRGDGSRQTRPVDQPAPTLGGSIRSRQVRGSGWAGRETVRSVDQPAPTLAFGNNAASWVFERPATAVCGDPRVSPSAVAGRAEDYDADGNYHGKRSMDAAIKITVQEAAILQGFRHDYPWQGSRTAQFGQIGNAVPPPLAAAILSVLIPSRVEAAA